MSLTKEMFMASLRNRRTGVSDENDDNEEEVEVNRGAGFGSAEINPEEVSRNPERASAGRKPKQREKTGKKPEGKPKGRENKFVKQPDVEPEEINRGAGFGSDEIKRIYSTFPENTNFFF
jgi:hypothetical protein